MDIRIFNKELDLIAIIDNFKSFRFNHKFYDIGECELHLPFFIEALEVLLIDNIIYVDSDNAFIIHTREIQRDSEGAEWIIVRGKSLLDILSRRINYKQIVESNKSGNEIVKRLVNENAITPTDTNRTINNLVLGSFADVVNIDYQNTYGNLLEEILGLSKSLDVSFYIELDYVNKKLILKSFKGVDRSINQSEVSYCIFSQDFENIEEQEYINSLESYKNTTLIAGAGEGIARKILEVGNTSGLERKELFTDARDLSDKEQMTRIIVDPETGEEREENYEVEIQLEQYNKMLEQRGYEKLAECKKVETLDSKISLNSNLKYKEDFSLGDIVTVINKKWNLTIDTKITEIEEVWEDSRSVSVTFGNNIPTLIDKIKIKMR